jgi:putative ABC transport system substrate-binding protein
VINRRTLLASSVASAWGAKPFAGLAQQRRLARVGWLTATHNPQIESFRAGMRELGYLEGRDWVLEERDADGNLDRVRDLAAELANQRIDVLVAVGFTAAKPAQEAVGSLPVVTMTNDFIGRGFAKSIARPGGNFTGVEMMAVDINVKWVELLEELLPGAARFFALAHPTGNRFQAQSVAEASRSRGKSLMIVDVNDIKELGPVFERLAAMRAEGLIVLASAVFHGYRQEIVELAARFRIPAIYEHRDFVTAGGLMSYGPDIDAVFRRIAYYVDRILKGAAPGDLPIEQPTTFNFVVNIKAAKALGLTFPPSVLFRADEIIE